MADVTRLRRGLARVLGIDETALELDFLISSLFDEGIVCTNRDVLQWLEELNSHHYFDVTQVPIDDLEAWYFDSGSGDLCHESGGFFRIRGLRVETSLEPITSWDQPIIDQPEIGILGLLAKRISGVMHFLFQAKPEPGNARTYQLSPTVQATQSNFRRLHGGNATKYLEFFMDSSGGMTVVDQLQSEQGARFFRKRNRNMIVLLKDNVSIRIDSKYRWLTLGQVRRLLRTDNVINMDARSVLANIDYLPEAFTRTTSVKHSKLRHVIGNTAVYDPDLLTNTLLSRHPYCCQGTGSRSLQRLLARARFEAHRRVRVIGLKDLSDWSLREGELRHRDDRHFKVIGVRVESDVREVHSWEQPILQALGVGIVAFVCKVVEGILYFLIQFKMECGLVDTLEIAPTIQCNPLNYDERHLPYLVDDIESLTGTAIVNSLQSEEGGRFYHKVNRNLIMRVDEGLVKELPPNYHWVPLWQLAEALKYTTTVNVEARSLLACLV